MASDSTYPLPGCPLSPPTLSIPFYLAREMGCSRLGYMRFPRLRWQIMGVHWGVGMAFGAWWDDQQPRLARPHACGHLCPGHARGWGCGGGAAQPEAGGPPNGGWAQAARLVLFVIEESSACSVLAWQPSPAGSLACWLPDLLLPPRPVPETGAGQCEAAHGVRTQVSLPWFPSELCSGHSSTAQTRVAMKGRQRSGPQEPVVGWPHPILGMV